MSLELKLAQFDQKMTSIADGICTTVEKYTPLSRTAILRSSYILSTTSFVASFPSSLPTGPVLIGLGIYAAIKPDAVILQEEEPSNVIKRYLNSYKKRFKNKERIFRASLLAMAPLSLLTAAGIYLFGEYTDQDLIKASAVQATVGALSYIPFVFAQYAGNAKRKDDVPG
jgi:hypothetical protein